MSLFHSASVRLTLGYLSLIMLLSVFFSVTLYRTSVSELNRNLYRQTVLINGLGFLAPSDRDAVNEQRTTQANETAEHLRTDLVYFNLVVLVCSAFASYILARRTLMPIEEALEAQNRFTADASHELRTPLAAMRAEIEVALREKNLTVKEASSLLHSNLEEVEHMEQLVGGLLTLARQDRALALEFAPVELKKIIERSVQRHQPKAKTKSMSISAVLAEVVIEGDEHSLAELVSILLDNAIKYSPVKTTIDLQLSKIGRNAVITVQDQGKGIEAVDLPYIFDRFYQADQSRTKTVAEGYGLGLSIAKKIVEMHSGSIEAKNQPGKGATFTVRLPLDQARPYRTMLSKSIN